MRNFCAFAYNKTHIYFARRVKFVRSVFGTVGEVVNSRVSGINEKYLCRFFKEFSGYTPTDYVNRMRVERAVSEMTVGGKSITDAAFDSGFNELSYFSRIFKKYIGTTPRDFLRTRKNK